MFNTAVEYIKISYFFFVQYRYRIYKNIFLLNILSSFIVLPSLIPLSILSPSISHPTALGFRPSSYTSAEPKMEVYPFVCQVQNQMLRRFTQGADGMFFFARQFSRIFPCTSILSKFTYQIRKSLASTSVHTLQSQSFIEARKYLSSIHPPKRRIHLYNYYLQSTEKNKSLLTC